MDLKRWLDTHGLGKYAELFAANEVDFDLLLQLTERDLDKLGLSVGAQRRLAIAIQSLEAADDSRDLRELAQSVAGERRQLTVIFCDMVGFTELASRLDPEILQKIVQVYEDTCAAAITRYDGYVFQRLGDGIVAFFGYPLAHEGEAERAIRAGLDIIAALSRLKVGDAGQLQVRIGIATGLVVVSSAEKGAVGETMNLASRLQGIAQINTIVVSERVRHLAGGAFEYDNLGVQALKGISRPTHAYRVLGMSKVASRFEAAHVEAGLTPLIGREQELGLLMQRWALAQHGDGQVALLSGEPGIGKSRLLIALQERLKSEGAKSMRFQCSPYHINSALWPSIANFERTLAFTRDETPESKLDKLESLIVDHYERPLADVRFVAAMLSIPCELRYGAISITPQKQKDELLRVLADLIEAAARKSPIVLLFEDAHWADPTTLEALDLLIDRVTTIPMLIVLTHRPEFQSRWRDHGHVSVLNLSKLTRAQSSAIVSQLAGGKALPKELFEEILAKTDGVPLFVEELTKSILESGELKEVAGRYEYVGSARNVTIPATLRDSLMARLDRYTPVKVIAQIGASIGREFSHELLSAVAPFPQTKLDSALAQLTGSGLAFRRGTPPEAIYTFKHALVRDAAYDSLLKSRRQELHRKIARELDERFPLKKETDPELLAHHLTEAGATEAAIPLWHKAGELALQRMAARDAVAHLDRGMALVRKLPPSSARDAEELEVSTSLAMAWLTYKGWAHPNTVSNLKRAWQLEQSLNRVEHMLRILWGLFVSTSCMGQIRESMYWAERMLQEGETRAQDDLRLAGHTAVVLAAYFLGQFSQVRGHARSILELYDPVRDRAIADLVAVDPKTYALVYDALAQWALGYPDQAATIAGEAIEHARARGHAFDLGWTLQMTAKHLDVYRRDPEACADRLDEFERVAREQSIEFFEHTVAPICRAAWLLLAGRAPEAETGLRESIPRWTAVGLSIDLPLYKTLHAQSAALSHQLGLALELMGEVLEQIERPGCEERSFFAEALRVKGDILQLRGDFAGAEAAFSASLAVSRTQLAKSWELRTASSYASLLLNQNRREEALQLLQPTYEWFTEGFETSDLKDARALLDKLEA